MNDGHYCPSNSWIPDNSYLVSSHLLQKNLCQILAMMNHTTCTKQWFFRPIQQRFWALTKNLKQRSFRARAPRNSRSLLQQNSSKRGNLAVLLHLSFFYYLYPKRIPPVGGCWVISTIRTIKQQLPIYPLTFILILSWYKL